MPVQYHNGINNGTIAAMDRRRWILISLSILVLISVGLLAWRPWQPEHLEKTDAAQQATTDRSTFFNTSDRLILLMSVHGATTTLYGSNALSQTTLQLDTDLPDTVSNYLATAQHWYSVSDQVVTRHAPEGDTVIGNLSQAAVPTDTSGLEPALAVDPAEHYLAWLSRSDHTESIHLFDLTTGSDAELFQEEPYDHYANFTFSPDGAELAFTVNDTKIVTLTLEGAEIHTPINIPFHQFHSLSWITLNEFGAVLTSTDANPEPFNPVVVIVDRDGNITERHAVFEKIGVPRVIWSADGSQFLFHHPWHNTFDIYNRYDQLVQQFTAAAPGKLLPFGYTAGQGPLAVTPSAIIDTTNSLITPKVPEPFVASAEDWEHYNSVERSILQQWPMDLKQYRFTTTADGLYVAFPYDAAVISEPVELVLIQTILQSFAVLPDVPAMTVVINDTNGNMLWEVDAVSAATVQSIVESVLHRPLEQLFVINKHHPIGKRTVKPENADYHYVGDLVYSKYGDYNPGPVLSLLHALQPNYHYYSNSDYVILQPNDFNSQVMPDGTVLFYTLETELVSATAWTQFGITIKPYEAPGITLAQWLSVNRSDQATEDPNFIPYQPLEIQHILTHNTYTDEYAVLAQNKVYVLTLQRDAGVTDEDRTLLNKLIQSLSFFYAIQR